MGLADRLVGKGEALRSATELAHEIAAFPHIAMRSDRLSAIRQWSLPEADAIAQETALATEARQREAREGATRFAAGAGRHGAKDR